MKYLDNNGLTQYDNKIKTYINNEIDNRTGYIIFPTFILDATTGHLSATGGKGVNFIINSNGHLESEVM